MWRAFCFGVLVLASGCSDSPDPQRYYPPEDQARRALDAALTAWQNGHLPGTVAGTSNPTVQFVDSQHAPTQRLKSFSVLGVAPGDGPKVYSVKLQLDGPSAEVKARYVVFGLDPVWVIRHEDYDMMNHWEHSMKGAKGASGTKQAP